MLDIIGNGPNCITCSTDEYLFMKGQSLDNLESCFTKNSFYSNLQRQVIVQLCQELVGIHQNVS